MNKILLFYEQILDTWLTVYHGVVDLVNSKDNVPVGDELSANLQSHLGVRFGLASHKSWPAPQQGIHQTTCWQKLAHKHASGGHWELDRDQ